MLALWGFWFEPSRLTIRRESFAAWNQEPLKVILFADLHAGAPYITLDYIESLVWRINDEKPDLILIAGDYAINHVLGGRPIEIEKVALALSHLRAKLGVFTVLGNHDWWNDGEKIRGVLEQNGIRCLDNQTRVISYGEHSKLNLIGLGDDYTGHIDSKTAFQRIDPSAPKLVLTHDPSAFLDLREKFDLGLAGHMHGGQVSLPFIGAIITPTRAPNAWAKGWVKDHAEGPLFITRGIGTSILPVRFNAPPEFAVLSLGASAQSH